MSTGGPTGGNGGSITYVGLPSGDTTGTTDTTAIQGAITTAAISGGQVRLAAGTYYVKKAGTLSPAGGGPPVSLDYCIKIPDNVVVCGVGRGVTILKLANSANATILCNSNPDTGNVNVAAHHMTLDGNKANQNGDGSKFGLTFIYVGAVAGTPATVSASWIEAKNVDGIGISFDGTGQVVGPIEAANLYSHNNAAHGFQSTHAMRRCTYSDIIVENNGQYGAFFDSSECNVQNVFAKSNTWDGIFIRNVTGESYTNLTASLNGRNGILVGGFTFSTGANWRAAGNSQSSSGTYNEIYFETNPVGGGYGETDSVAISGVYAGLDSHLGAAFAGYGIKFDSVVTAQKIALSNVVFGATVTGTTNVPRQFWGGGQYLGDFPNLMTATANALGYGGLSCGHPAMARTTFGVAGSTAYLTGIHIPAGTLITNLIVLLAVVPVGTNPTNTRLVITDSTGKVKAITADIGTSLKAGAVGQPQQVALTSTFTPTGDGFYYIGYWMNGAYGTTQPSFFVGLGSLILALGSNPIPFVTAALSTDAVVGTTYTLVSTSAQAIVSGWS